MRKRGEKERRRGDDGENDANKSAKNGVKRRSRRFFASNRAPVACASDDSGYNKVSGVALFFEKRSTVDFCNDGRPARGNVEIVDGDEYFLVFDFRSASRARLPIFLRRERYVFLPFR